MRKTALIPVVVLTLGLALAGCSSTPAATSAAGAASSPMPTASATQDTMARTGTFAGLNGKSVTGTVTVTGSQLTFAGFSSDEGPDLHVYLTKGTDEAAVAAGKQIDAIAFDKGAQTFSLNGVDASTYTYVVIHCDKAKAVFGAATLS